MRVVLAIIIGWILATIVTYSKYDVAYADTASYPVSFPSDISMLGYSNKGGSQGSSRMYTNASDLQLEYSCELGFETKGSIQVEAPEWLIDELSEYECTKQQILVKLAFYESSFNPDAKNKCFEGLYQIGKCDGGTYEYVNGLTGIDNDHDMAWWIYENYPHWFETYSLL